MSTVSLAAFQFSCIWDRDQNVATVERRVRSSAREGAQVILIPELFETPYFCAVQNQDYLKLARPLAAPGILSGWLLALTLSFDDVVTSSFLAGPENTTLPMAIFSGLRVGLNPQINAVATLMVVAVAAIVGISFAAVRLKRGPSGHRAPEQ